VVCFLHFKIPSLCDCRLLIKTRKLERKFSDNNERPIDDKIEPKHSLSMPVRRGWSNLYTDRPILMI